MSNATQASSSHERSVFLSSLANDGDFEPNDRNTAALRLLADAVKLVRTYCELPIAELKEPFPAFGLLGEYAKDVRVVPYDRSSALSSCTSAFTDGMRIYVNLDYVYDRILKSTHLPTLNLAFVLLHELYHIAKGHVQISYESRQQMTLLGYSDDQVLLHNLILHESFEALTNTAALDTLRDGLCFLLRWDGRLLNDANSIFAQTILNELRSTILSEFKDSATIIGRDVVVDFTTPDGTRNRFLIKAPPEKSGFLFAAAIDPKKNTASTDLVGNYVEVDIDIIADALISYSVLNNVGKKRGVLLDVPNYHLIATGFFRNKTRTQCYDYFQKSSNVEDLKKGLINAIRHNAGDRAAEIERIREIIERYRQGIQVSAKEAAKVSGTLASMASLMSDEDYVDASRVIGRILSETIANSKHHEIRELGKVAEDLLAIMSSVSEAMRAATERLSDAGMEVDAREYAKTVRATLAHAVSEFSKLVEADVDPDLAKLRLAGVAQQVASIASALERELLTKIFATSSANSDISKVPKIGQALANVLDPSWLKIRPSGENMFDSERRAVVERAIARSEVLNAKAEDVAQQIIDGLQRSAIAAERLAAMKDSIASSSIISQRRTNHEALKEMEQNVVSAVMNIYETMTTISELDLRAEGYRRSIVRQAEDLSRALEEYSSMIDEYMTAGSSKAVALASGLEYIRGALGTIAKDIENFSETIGSYAKLHNDSTHSILTNRVQSAIKRAVDDVRNNSSALVDIETEEYLRFLERDAPGLVKNLMDAADAEIRQRIGDSRIRLPDPTKLTEAGEIIRSAESALGLIIAKMRNEFDATTPTPVPNARTEPHEGAAYVVPTMI